MRALFAALIGWVCTEPAIAQLTQWPSKDQVRPDHPADAIRTRDQSQDGEGDWAYDGVSDAEASP
jgi:hypothetical protein